MNQDNDEQEIKQKNIGSGSSANLNCGTNVADSILFEQMTCSIEEETPSPGPVIAIKPVVTQRTTEIPIVGSGPFVGEAQCNPDEVVTGGGYDIPRTIRVPSPIVTTFKEFAVNNAWHIEVSNNDPIPGTIRVFAECLKLVPA